MKKKKSPQQINYYGTIIVGVTKIVLFIMCAGAWMFGPWQLTAFLFLLAWGLDWTNDGRWFPWSPPATIACRKCGGSGFSGYGTGYDDVCDWCGGYCEELYDA